MNALASRADEGRSTAAISLGELPNKLSRGFPNGATHPDELGIPPAEHIGWMEVSGGSETSQYPEEQRKSFIPLVVANEKGHSPNLMDLVVLEPMSIGCSKAGKTDLDKSGSYQPNPS